MSSFVASGARCACVGILAAALAACGGGGGGSAGAAGGSGGSGGSGGGGGGTSPGTFSIAEQTLNFAAASLSQTSPGPVTLHATATGLPTGSNLYIVARVTGPAIQAINNIQITGTTTGTAQVIPASQLTLGPGSFASTITVTACTSDPNCSGQQLSGSPVTINVTYTVNGLKTNSSGLNYSLGNSAPTGPNVSQSLTVTGYPSETYTASADAPWLSVTPVTASTAAAASVSISLVPSETDKLNSGSYTGNVTLHPPVGDPVVVPVSLSIARTQVNYASPYLQLSNSAATVIIRGEHFGLVHPTDVKFGSVSASAYSVISDTQIQAAVPNTLAAGTYAVHVLSQEGVDRTRASVTVVDPIAYALTTLPYPVAINYPADMVYDGGRAALLVAGYDTTQGARLNQVVRYQYFPSTHSWGTPTTQTVYELGALALTADGATLLAGHGDETDVFDTDIDELDPVTLVTTRSTKGFGVEPVTGIVVTNEGRAIVKAGSNALQPIKWYSPLRPQALPLVPDINGPFALYNGAMAVSGDGSTVWFSDGLGQDMDRWDAATGTFFENEGYPLFTNVGLNADGSRRVMSTPNQGAVVYDVGLNMIGSLPNTTQLAVLTPDGHKAYTYDSNGTVRIFDLSVALTGSDPYPEVTPAIAVGTSPPLPFTYVVKMILSPDGDTLFIAGDTGVLVVPTH